MTLKLWQIYFKDEQLTHLYPFSTPHKNITLTPFFENACIAELVPKSDCDIISVCSWALRHKRNSGAAEVILKNTYGSTDLKEESILNCDADVMIFTPVNHRDILGKMIQWHGLAMSEAVKEFSKFMKFPETVENAIYENHFAAKREVYHSYVETCLSPALEFIGEKEVFKAPSGYRAKKERLGGGQEAREALRILGLTDYPIAPFILERLFSVWIDKQKLKVVNL